MVNISGGGADHSDLEALSVLVNYRRWIVDAFAPYLGGAAVEYGAGIGSISEEIVKYVDTLHVVEPIDTLFVRLAEKFSATPNVRAEFGALESCVGSTPDQSYDSIVMVNVLEHIADDRWALGQFHRVMRHGGHICIFVPALTALFSDYDRLVGHYRRYEMTPLRSLVLDSGFEIRRATYFDFMGILPWLMMRLSRQTRIRSGLAEVYDRFAVPVGRLIETAIRPPIGKNILLIARKP